MAVPIYLRIDCVRVSKIHEAQVVQRATSSSCFLFIHHWFLSGLAVSRNWLWPWMVFPLPTTVPRWSSGLSPWGPTQALMFFFGMMITNVSLFVFSYMVFGTASRVSTKMITTQSRGSTTQCRQSLRRRLDLMPTCRKQ